MAVKVCTKCGELNNLNATSCISCGASLINASITGVSEDEKKLESQVKHCPVCDRVLSGDVSACPHCGAALSKIKERQYYATNSQSSVGNIGIYVLSFLIPLVGIIVGAIWLANSDRKEDGVTALALAILGIIVSAVVMGIMF